MLKIVMIRHFATAGNLQKRYIGITDESLCEEGRRKIKEFSYPSVDTVYVSPLKRCRETAKLIYPNQAPRIMEGFKECDFGDFENKNYLELSLNSDYQAWVDSGGTLPFPKGENPRDFKLRCITAFEEMVAKSREIGDKTVALVVHGGTIMSILEKYALPHDEYYHWQVENGDGYIAEIEDDISKIRMREIKKIRK